MNFLNNQEKKYGQVLVVIGAALISFSPIFVVLSGVSASASAFYRVALSIPPLFILLFMFHGKLWQGTRQFGIALLCSIAYSLDLTCWHQSILLIGPGLATILGNFQVFTLAFYSIVFLHTRITPRIILSIPLSIMGLYLICGPGFEGRTDGFLIGIILALSTAIWYGGYVILLRLLQVTFEFSGKIANLCMISILTSLITGSVVFLSGDSFLVPGIDSWLYLTGYAVICQVIAWILISTGLPFTTPIKVGIILLLQPAGAFIWDILIFQLPFTIITLVGVLLTLGAIYLGSTSDSSPIPETNRNE